jgi:hypothetical protein
MVAVAVVLSATWYQQDVRRNYVHTTHPMILTLSC